MKTVILRHLFKAKDKGEIYATMLDFRRFGAFHPLMKSVKLVGRANNDEATYFVNEELPLGRWIKLKPKYTIYSMEIKSKQTIQLSAKVNGFFKLRVTISFTEPDTASNMELLETVELSQIPILTNFFLRVFREAHTSAFSRFRKQLHEADAAMGQA